jgi:hypothetical protein
MLESIDDMKLKSVAAKPLPSRILKLVALASALPLLDYCD